MPNYGMPGVTMGRRGARVLGAFVVAVAAAGVLGWRADLYSGGADATLRIQIRTSQVGEGIIAGTKVRMDGVTIGRIAEITPVEQGRQLLTLDLDHTESASLTDSFAVDYAPENLFGISALTMRRNPGGQPLRTGAVIDLADTRVADVTMGSLLRTLSSTSTEVLTPKLVELVTRFHSDLAAFSPLLEAMVMLSRQIADTQRYPTPFLLDQYSSFASGLGGFVSSTFQLLDALINIEIFVNDRPRYDATIEMIVSGALPAIGRAGDRAREELAGYTALFTPLMHSIAATVPAPGRSRAEIVELIDRLDRMFTETPEGPAVDLSVTLRGIPGLAVPLLGGLPPLPAPGGDR